MLNFCIFVFIIYAVASSVKTILNENFYKNIIMFAKAFKPIKNTIQKPAKKSKIVRINSCTPQKKFTEMSKHNERAA